ncbi:MAG: N-acetylmuramoyl-L-alanine amidase [Candidatus Accumulibacter sp.]|jgi:N-acetylmuramoyl-L-alanine amidase|nr:N-acetylmuramoyl-L-alanine amidase [Accumulibacter sp.]
MKRLVPLVLLVSFIQPAAAADVAIDVGHTLEAYGATSARGFKEFDFNRNLAEKLALALRDPKRGHTARLINFDGKIERLDERPRQAAGVDFFISIHHDSVQPDLLEEWEWNGEKQTYSDQHAGFSLFVSRKNPAPETSLRCASAMGARLRRMGFGAATHHTGSMANTPRPYADEDNAVHYYDNLVVLYRTTLPAALFEAGVIKHRAEEAALRDPEYQARMADALATGIAACLYVRDAGPPEGAP